jgi:hypothetical protein
VAGTVDFKAMDTNGDGTITGTDDPYLPYYPGQDKFCLMAASLISPKHLYAS